MKQNKICFFFFHLKVKSPGKRWSCPVAAASIFFFFFKFRQLIYFLFFFRFFKNFLLFSCHVRRTSLVKRIKSRMAFGFLNWDFKVIYVEWSLRTISFDSCKMFCLVIHRKAKEHWLDSILRVKKRGTDDECRENVNFVRWTEFWKQ